MADETPVLDTIALMTAASIGNCNLDGRELMLVRIAALAAASAPPASYLGNTGAAIEVGVTLEDVQDVLVAIAPIVGSARVVMAAGNVARALGFAIDVLDAELQAELDEG
jgi:hypothetical protein